jgi:hypothetical protein
MGRWLTELFSEPLRVENEQLKARVRELEVVVAEAVADAAYWKRQATRNAE